MDKGTRALGMILAVTAAFIVIAVSWVVITDVERYDPDRDPDNNPNAVYIGQYIAYEMSGTAAGISSLNGTIRLDVTGATPSYVTCRYDYRINVLFIPAASGSGSFDADPDSDVLSFPMTHQGSERIYVNSVYGNRSSDVYDGTFDGVYVKIWMGNNGVIYKARISGNGADIGEEYKDLGIFDITLTLTNMKGTDLFGFLNLL